MQTFTFEYTVDNSRHLVLNLPESVPPGRHRIAVLIDPPAHQPAATPDPSLAAETPERAELWSRLLGLREQAIMEGMPLLGWEEINAEV